jgi:hypothetical protein
MAGRPAKVTHVYDAFIAKIDAATSLVSAVQALPTKVRPSNNPGLHPKYVGQVVELAFMGVVASWEEFIERSLVRFLAGARTNGGYTPTLKAGKANTIQHAYELLSLDPNYNPANSYLKVSDPRWVRRVADFYFSAHTYSHLQNASDLIRHANSIRNRVAHDSTKCKADFKQTALYFLEPANGQLKQGYGAAALLLAPVQRHFGQQAIQQNKTHFNAYCDFFRGLARKIVPL